MRLSLLLLAACTTVAPAPQQPAAQHAAATAAHYPDRPRLTVVIVVDQFRADYLTRFDARFTGGYRWLLDHAAWYPWARYDFLQAMTGPGHATVLTGSYPYRNGISLNAWCELDAKGKTVSTYCVQDADAPLVGGNVPVPIIDPPTACVAQSVAGVSPRKLTGSTLGDEMKLAGLGSRVVSIALKDRAAVLMGGHLADLALWFDQPEYKWITSRYYTEKLPPWVDALNAQIAAHKGETVGFASQGPGSGLTNGTFEIAGRIGEGSSLRTPYGLTLTVDAALAAVRELQLGQHGTPDLLAISFSTHDVLGHDLGPNRRELEELTVAEDHELKRLLDALGNLDDVVIALTGDHGIPPVPAYVRGLGRDATLSGYVDGDAVRDAAEQKLVRRFGKPPAGTWVSGTVDLNYWLNTVSLAEAKVARAEAEAELARAVREAIPSAEFVLTRSQIEARQVPGGLLAQHAARGYRPGQTGDVVVVARPYFTPTGDVDAHFTDYAFDTTVPLLIAGKGVRPGVRAEEAHVVDLAPTLSYLLGIVPPSLNEGRVLSESVAR